MLTEESARKAMDGWKKSPGHNANLLQKRAHEIGIGAAGWKLDGGQDIFRVVQVFATECPGKQRSKPWIVKCPFTKFLNRLVSFVIQGRRL